MPFNGSGGFARVMDWTNDRDAAIKIKADRHDQNDDDIAAGLSNTICRDGQSQITANIPFNGKKITGLANPTDPQDAVTKNYADALRTFSTPIILSGAGANGRVRFTGATGDNGIEWTNPGDGVFFGVDAASGQWVWNDKADGTGTDVMSLDPSGTTALTLASVVPGMGSGPWLRLARRDPAPVANSVIGAIGLMARTSGGSEVEFAGLYGTLLDPTTGSMDGSLTFRTQLAGVLTVQMTISDGVQISKDLGVTGALSTGHTITSGSTITSGGQVFSGLGSFIGTAVTAVLGTAAGSGGTIYLRPTAYNSATGQMTVGSNGNVTVSGALTAQGTVSAPTVSAINVSETGNFSATGATAGVTTSSGLTDSSRNTTTGASHHRFYNPNGQVGAINTSGTTTTYVTSSDENLKEFTGHYDPQAAVAIIRADPVRAFNWKADGTAAIGWGAQTSYAISPDLAAPPPAPPDGETAPAPGEPGYTPWGVDKGARTPYLWAALTWCLDQIDDLTARVAQLEGSEP